MSCKALICILLLHVASGQVKVLSANGEYPMLRNETREVTNGNRPCSCQDNHTANWSAWSTCRGQMGAFECHQGIRYRRSICSKGREHDCSVTEWQHCYHEATCKGQWTEWTDKEVSGCSSACGGGQRLRVRICSKGTNIGLFCAGKHRRPYDVIVEPCNLAPCGGELNSTNYSSFSEVAKKRPLDDATESSFSANYLTWTVLGVAMLIITSLLVIMAALCFKRPEKESRCQRDDLGLVLGVDIIDGGSNPKNNPFIAPPTSCFIRDEVDQNEYYQKPSQVIRRAPIPLALFGPPTNASGESPLDPHYATPKPPNPLNRVVDDVTNYIDATNTLQSNVTEVYVLPPPTSDDVINPNTAGEIEATSLYDDVAGEVTVGGQIRRSKANIYTEILPNLDVII
ncbi:uncharacterized protein LOC143449438 [Clavelina lepadiformis]|uniref:uncharacterized protein LOC143449438 n=1 Tax=Clavelina lepadiformis TaxID=159417 RepID=UPI004042AB73